MALDVHNRIRVGHVFRHAGQIRRGCPALPDGGFGAAFTVGSAYRDASLVEHLGEHAHAGSADADKMRVSQYLDTFLSIERRIGGVRVMVAVTKTLLIWFSALVSLRRLWRGTRLRGHRIPWFSRFGRVSRFSRRVRPDRGCGVPWCRRHLGCRIPKPCCPSPAVPPHRPASRAHGRAPTPGSGRHH